MSPESKTKSEKRAAAAEVMLFKALSNPLRYRLMMVLGEREASPKELAEMLGEGFHKTWEHVRLLEGWGLIELVDTDQRRGGTQHFYRAKTLPVLDAAEWEQLPQFARETGSATIIRSSVREITASVEAGIFDAHRNRVLVRKPVLVDEQGFGEIDEAAIEHLAKITEIEAQSAARRIESGEPAHRVMTLTIAFETAPPEPAEPN
jgi:DNA-binding transcriptional ArsR family regulator